MGERDWLIEWFEEMRAKQYQQDLAKKRREKETTELIAAVCGRQFDSHDSNGARSYPMTTPKVPYDAEWTEAMAIRRAELIESEYALSVALGFAWNPEVQVLPYHDQLELDALQEAFGEFQNRHFPLPMGDSQ